MKGGKKMRKLNKINLGRLDTIEAYACVCSCNCSGACTGCGCAVSSAKYTTSNNLNSSQDTTAKRTGSSNGYRK